MLTLAVQDITEPSQSDVNWVLLAGLLQPLVVTLLTKKNASPGLMRVANVVLAGLVGAANALYEDQQNGGPYDWKRAMVVAVGVWLTSATAYVHLWKDTTAIKKVDDATANFGMGSRDAALRMAPVTKDDLVEALDLAPAQANPTDHRGAGNQAVPGPVPEDPTRAGPGDPALFTWKIEATPIAPPPPPPEPRQPL
jgi:hypothetical protein